jgi:hypothetical protein
MRPTLVVCLAAVVAAAPGAQATSRVLPAASFTVPGYVAALAASGARVGVATLSDFCVIRVAELARATTPTTVKTSALPCSRARDGSDAYVEDLWLGKTAAAATVVDSPSPHGDSYTLWTGPLPQGPLRSRLGLGSNARQRRETVLEMSDPVGEHGDLRRGGKADYRYTRALDDVVPSRENSPSAVFRDVHLGQLVSRQHASEKFPFLHW